jgi:hypothetical protein
MAFERLALALATCWSAAFFPDGRAIGQFDGLDRRPLFLPSGLLLVQAGIPVGAVPLAHLAFRQHLVGLVLGLALMELDLHRSLILALDHLGGRLEAGREAEAAQGRRDHAAALVEDVDRVSQLLALLKSLGLGEDAHLHLPPFAAALELGPLRHDILRYVGPAELERHHVATLDIHCPAVVLARDRRLGPLAFARIDLIAADRIGGAAPSLRDGGIDDSDDLDRSLAHVDLVVHPQDDRLERDGDAARLLGALAHHLADLELVPARHRPALEQGVGCVEQRALERRLQRIGVDLLARLHTHHGLRVFVHCLADLVLILIGLGDSGIDIVVVHGVVLRQVLAAEDLGAVISGRARIEFPGLVVIDDTLFVGVDRRRRGVGRAVERLPPGFGEFPRGPLDHRLGLERSKGCGTRFDRAAGGAGRHRQRPRAHRVGLALEPGIVVDVSSAVQLRRRLHPALGLLRDVPGLVRQMMRLPRREMDVAALGEGVGLELGRPRRIVMDADVVHRDSGQGLDAGLQPLGQPRGARPAPRHRRRFGRAPGRRVQRRRQLHQLPVPRPRHLHSVRRLGRARRPARLQGKLAHIFLSCYPRRLAVSPSIRFRGG